jgi:hypothetical protein
MTATLENDDAFVVVMFKKGAPRPHEYHGDPNVDSPHEFDIAVQDRNGALSHLFIGGDELIDLNWIDVMSPPPPESTLEERHEDLLLALELLERLEESLALSRAYEWEIRGLRTSLQATLREVSFTGPQDLQLEPPQSGTLDEILPPPSQVITYTHVVQIRKGPCCWDYGEHSAVLVHLYDAGNQYLTSIETGNHGRQATHNSMSTAANCPKAYGGRANFAPTVQPYKATDTFWDGDAGGCNTPYGTTAAKHVCNDDSLAQFYNVKNNSAAVSWLTCGDGLLRTVAPHCNY